MLKANGQTLILGDSLTIDPPPFDNIVTDPPFGVSKPGSRQVGRPGKGARNLDFFPDDDCESGYIHADNLIRIANMMPARGVLLAFVGHMQFARIVSNIGAAWSTRFVVWSKPCPPPPPPGVGFVSGSEIAVLAYRAGATWGDIPKSNVFEHDAMRHGARGKNGHPTQKPIQLIERLVSWVCPYGETVLDPYCGSGTTLEACTLVGRRGIGIEIDPQYHSIAATRLDRPGLFRDEVERA